MVPKMKTTHQAIVEINELPAIVELYNEQCLLELERSCIDDFDTPKLNFKRKLESDFDHMLTEGLIQFGPNACVEVLGYDGNLLYRDYEEWPEGSMESLMSQLIASVLEQFPYAKSIRRFGNSEDALIIYSEEL